MSFLPTSATSNLQMTAANAPTLSVAGQQVAVANGVNGKIPLLANTTIAVGDQISFFAASNGLVVDIHSALGDL